MWTCILQSIQQRNRGILTIGMPKRLLQNVHHRRSYKSNHLHRLNLFQNAQGASYSQNSTRQFDYTLYRLSQFLLTSVLNPLCLVPSTLSQIFPSEQQLITRYVRLIKQKYYEKTTETIYCPLEYCQTPIIPRDKESKLIVCPKCTYPFCKFCRSSWHGGGTGCKVQNGYRVFCSTLMIGLWRSSWKLTMRDGEGWRLCMVLKC